MGCCYVMGTESTIYIPSKKRIYLTQSHETIITYENCVYINFVIEV